MTFFENHLPLKTKTYFMANVLDVMAVTSGQFYFNKKKYALSCLVSRFPVHHELGPDNNIDLQNGPL